MGNGYGPYIMYFLSQLMQKRQEQERSAAGLKIFGRDETGAVWHKENNIEILEKFCKEGLPQAKKHGHFIIGNGNGKDYIGIPGRFLIGEQPGGGKTGFTLWQPLAGGEEYCTNPEEMDDETIDNLYGYWIARLDASTLKIHEP